MPVLPEFSLSGKIAVLSTSGNLAGDITPTGHAPVTALET